MSDAAPHILIVDDVPELSAAFADDVQAHVGEAFEVTDWCPGTTDTLPDAFVDQLRPTTKLVVTDYDLSEGMKGLFGPSIVEWCQIRLIPVADYSRKPSQDMPAAPELFAMHIPRDESGPSVAGNLAQGLVQLDTAISGFVPDDNLAASLSVGLARILDRPNTSTAFGPYMDHLVGSSRSILDMVLRRSLAGTALDIEALRPKIIRYVLSHFLRNLILRYPGPILHARATAAYLALPVTALSEDIKTILEPALYTGPFSREDSYYWRDQLDDVMDDLVDGVDDTGIGSTAELYRVALETHLGIRLAPHGCARDGCEGRRGGFWCPLTGRPVCARGDCSVASSTLVPQGASVSRVERVFYDEWAPLLGF